MRPSSVVVPLMLACLSLLHAAEADWKTLKSENCRFYYASGGEGDVRAMAGYLNDAVETLRGLLGGQNVDPAVKAIDCEVYLHRAPDASASEDHARSRSEERDGRTIARIDLLTPSAYSDTALSSVGLPKRDAQYQRKLIAHEYAGLVLAKICSNKPRGWRYYRAPSWFVQGFEEYVALQCCVEAYRTKVMGRWVAQVKTDPDRISFGFGVSVADDYTDGALLLHFMHESFGGERVLKVLKSEQPTFAKAVPSALGVTLEEFAQRWDAWRSAR